MHWFPFLCWIKFCSGCLRQVFFIWGTKKVVTGHVRQVVILYSIDFMDIGPGRLRWFDCMFCPFRLQDSLKCTVISVKKITLIFCLQKTSKFPTSLCYCFCWAWLGMPKVPNVTSLRYVFNISRKSWGINTTFCMKINNKVFYLLVVLFLLVIARHAQSTKNSKFVMSIQYLKKKGSMKLTYCIACR